MEHLLVGALSLLALGLGTVMALEHGEFRRLAAYWVGWLVPGMGHLILGRPKKALFFAGSVLFLLVSGLWLTGWGSVAFSENPFYYVGRCGCGLTILLGEVLPKSYPRPDLPVSWYDPGLLYVCVAGLLNFVIMLSLLSAPAKGAGKRATAPKPEAQPLDAADAPPPPTELPPEGAP